MTALTWTIRAVWAAVAAVAATALLLLALGWRPVVLVSDSMAPAAPAGSLLVVRPVPGAEVEIGDILTVDSLAANPVSHRVIAIETHGGARYARLQGDANAHPDRGRVELDGRVLRTAVVVGAVGGVISSDSPLLWGGLTLLAISAAGLLLLRRVEVVEVARFGDATDGRIAALQALLGSLERTGVDPVVLRDLARIRVAESLYLPSVERAEQATPLDDAARFVLLALVDADVDALRRVTPGGAAYRAASDQVTAWWEEVVVLVADEVVDALGSYLLGDRAASLSAAAAVEYRPGDRSAAPSA